MKREKFKYVPRNQLKKKYSREKKRGGDYSDEDDYENEDEYDDDFIDDDEGEEDAQRELSKMLGGYRQKIRENRYDDESSDMEVGFDELEAEDRYSRKIGKLEDERERKYIEREMKEEMMMKMKKTR